MQSRNLLAALIIAASVFLVWTVFGPDADTETGANAVTSDTHAPYASADWEALSTKRLNISLYTFRDDNRNGNHDLGDTPMAGIYVALQSPDGTVSRAKSNINGYANFIMSTGDSTSHINEPGSYRFTVEPPPGWRISSANAVQDITFRTQPGAPSGITAVNAPQWVGLMPELVVSGKVRAAAGAPLPADLQVVLTGPRGASFKVETGEGGALLHAVQPGRWVLQVSSAAQNWRAQRTFEVSDAPVALSDITVGTAQPEPLAFSVEDDFDWLQRSVIEKIPNGHLGLNWDYLLAVHNQEYSGPGYVNGLMSGHAVAYNSSGQSVTIGAQPGQVFDFVGGYFSVAWPEAQGETLTVTAWRNGSVAGQLQAPLSYLGPVWVQADMHGIDKLTLTAQHYWQFVADNLSFRLAAPVSDE